MFENALLIYYLARSVPNGGRYALQACSFFHDHSVSSHHDHEKCSCRCVFPVRSQRVIGRQELKRFPLVRIFTQQRLAWWTTFPSIFVRTFSFFTTFGWTK